MRGSKNWKGINALLLLSLKIVESHFFSSINACIAVGIKIMVTLRAVVTGCSGNYIQYNWSNNQFMEFINWNSSRQFNNRL